MNDLMLEELADDYEDIDDFDGEEDFLDDSEASDYAFLDENAENYALAERSSRSAWQRARRRARAKALARARARRARSRAPVRRIRARPYLPPAKTTDATVRTGFNRVKADVQKTRSKVQQVDLESKVKADALAAALSRQSKRIGGSENAHAATKAMQEIFRQFPKLNDDNVLKTALPLLPLAFLKPPQRGTGIESLIKDPRVLSSAFSAALAFYRARNPEIVPRAKSLRLGPARNLQFAPGNTRDLTAFVLDQNDNVISGEGVYWTTLNDQVAVVDRASGRLTTVGEGETQIIATSRKDPTLFSDITVKVKP